VLFQVVVTEVTLAPGISHMVATNDVSSALLRALSSVSDTGSV